MRKTCLLLALFFSLAACTNKSKEIKPTQAVSAGKVIVDCNYTFEQAVEGCNAPKSIIEQLVLLPVKYYSTDGLIHQGQIVTNKEIAADVTYMFNFMLKEHFPVAHAIPIVKYGWNDDLSMQDNNTSSFCYRDVSYSLHARGLAIDINPYFNPVIWKPGWNRVDKPQGAVHNPAVKGTFTENNPVVLEFEKLHFHWGGKFSAKYDFHHFEKGGYYRVQAAKADSLSEDSYQSPEDEPTSSPNSNEEPDNNQTQE
jgi:hypothetical protein